MSNQTYKRKHNTHYLAEFFEKGYILPSILLGIIFTTILAVIDQFDFFKQLEAEDQKTFFIILFVFYLACIVIHSCISIKKDKVGSGDSAAFSFIFVALFYFIYLLVSGVKLNELPLYQWIIVIGCAVFGFVLTLLNSAFYDFYDDGADNNFNKKGFSSYYGATKSVYGFFGILVCSLIINCIFYVTLDLYFTFKNFVTFENFDKNTLFFDAFKNLVSNNLIYLILLCVAGFFLALFFIISIFDRKTNALDLLFFGFLYSIPVTFAMIYFLDNKSFNSNLTLFGIITGVVLLLYHIRFFVCKKRKIDYLKWSFNKNLFLGKDTFLAIGLTAFIVVFVNMANELNLLSLFVKNDKLNIQVELIPYAILCVAGFFAFIAMAIGLIASIAKINTKHFLACDRTGIYNFCFAFFNLIIVVLVPLCITKTMVVSVKDIVILASYMFISIGVLIMRKKSTK